MIEKTFEQLWDWVVKRSERGVLTVQERSELEHIFNLMKACDCQSYLEIGTAEGNSLYVLGHGIRDGGAIDYIDFGEEHTKEARDEVLSSLKKDHKITGHFGDSTNPQTVDFHNTYPFMPPIYLPRHFDCILIDAGHNYANVLSDSILYAPLATKYVFWHDIQLPEVKAAYEWFKKRWDLGTYSEFISSDSFGYGICEVRK